MQGLVGAIERNEAKACQAEMRPTLMYRLNQREERLTQELQEIQKAKEILAKNPEFLELIDSVQRIGIY